MEDKAFVSKKAREESFLFIVDSGKRNKAAYPNPNEYSIEFDRPFTNVFGFDLLYASVPRTEYVVDLDHNRLVYTCNNNTHTLDIEPGDYNLVQLCDALNQGLQGVIAEPHSAPYQLRSRIRFQSVFPFSIDASKSTIARLLGLYDTTPVYTSAETGVVEQRVFQGPYAGIDLVSVPEGGVIRQPFVPSATGVCTKVLVQVSAESVDVQCRILDDADNVLGQATISGSENAEVNIDNGLTIVAGMTYYLEITATTENTSVYRNIPLDGGVAAEVLVDDTWDSLGDALCCDVYVAYDRHEIEGPGLVNLTGERHVILRCDEIESYFHRGRKTEAFHGGIGMVRMGANGFQEQRFDFVSFPSRRLADPIGKLKTLTFRLTKPDGTLYNARGVDHTLLCVIKYYVMVQDDTTPTLVNPNYTPDVVQFLAEKWRAESEQMDALKLEEFKRKNEQRTQAYRM